MKMKTVYINGRFLTQRITGEQRYAIEILKEWDKMNSIKMIVLCPKGQRINLKLNNIEIREVGSFKKQLWVHWSFARYVKKNKGVSITLCGLSPIFRPDFWTVHDITFIKDPKSFSWKFKLLYKLVYKINMKRCKRIFTVSNFSREEIAEEYNIKRENIDVMYSAVSNDLISGKSIEFKLPFNNTNPVFLSVGSVKGNKNISYIYKLAIKNPRLNFLIVGGKNNLFNKISVNELENLKFSGYLSDENLNFLYKSVYGFIIPSIYEGFGLPPLEAIVCGCKYILVSDIAVFREIYDKNVNFFNPYDDGFEISLDNLVRIDEFAKKYYLSRFNYSNVANDYINVIKKYNG